MSGNHSSSGHSENNRRTHHHGVAARIGVATVVAWGMALALAAPAAAAPPPEDDQVSAQAVRVVYTNGVVSEEEELGQAALFNTVVTARKPKDCNTTSWTWPFCDIGRPSIPRFNVDGPRPPLIPKDYVWCTYEGVITIGNGIGWLRVRKDKHNIRFWPDYYTLTFVGVLWRNGRWEATRQPVYITEDCDA